MFEPKLFLNLAETLKDSKKDNLFESRIRTSISRSYYSIFLKTRVKIGELVGRDLEKTKDIHEIIIEGLKTSGDPKISSFGTTLQSLRTYRNQADYLVSTNLNPQKAELAYKLADALFDDLKGLDPTSLTSQFRTT